jgi:spermidine/putrescine transport system ATP-binding protein
MQLELKRIQHEVGITFIHVTHDQEEAMTMADQIVVMNGGRIEQIGSPAELYERPTTAFVAGFLGVSNLLTGTVAGPERVALDGGIEIAVPQQTLAGRTGKVAVGIRPEKIRIGEADRNQLAGTVRESAYIGVSTQYIVETTAGAVSIYVQNERSGATSLGVGEQLTLSWSPESTFVVDPPEASA